jgi:hypothetical protein
MSTTGSHKTKDQRRREAERRAAESTRRKCGHNHNDNGARRCPLLPVDEFDAAAHHLLNSIFGEGA